MTWDQVTLEAEKYTKPLEKTCSRYLQEIEGLAAGAGVSPLDVLALNVRTEIMFGLFTEASPTKTNGNSHQHHNNDDIPSEGCTSLAWVDSAGGEGSAATTQSFLAQNWDWQPGQRENIVICHVSPTDEPTISKFSMITEAGLIGKIGFNANGVGCCLNAIRARGVDPARLPVHFALRTVLESQSRKDAIAKLEAVGVAGSAHILVADETGSNGLECSPVSGIKKIAMDADGRVYHSNHLVLEHPGVDEPAWLADSHTRLARIKVLAGTTLADRRAASGEDLGRLLEIFKCEEGYPGSINRKAEGESTSETLFTIIMNLSRREAWVKFGRPTEGGKEINLSF